VKVPGFNSTEGSRAVITQRVGEELVRRNGRVVRLFGDLDPAGQMARLLVEVTDPFGFGEDSETSLPLLLGAYVTIDVEATPVRAAIQVPRYALREGDRAFVVDRDNQLEVRDVVVAWRMEDSVLVTEGLLPGDRVITSRLAQPVSGMALRVDPGAAPTGEPRAEARP
jgi:hypothetical protein